VIFTNLNGGVRHDPGDTDLFGSNMRAQKLGNKEPPKFVILDLRVSNFEAKTN